MQIEPRDSAVLAGSKNNQVLTGIQVHRRKNPFGRLLGIVGQRPAGKINASRTAIEKLDPITELAIFIEQAGRANIRTEKLVDDNIGQGSGGGRIVSHRPTLAVEEIGGGGLIANVVTPAPGKRHAPCGGWCKLKDIRAETVAGDIGGSHAID